MKIAVLIKQVPDSDEIKMDSDKGTMIREGNGNIVNPLDLNALQAALDVKKKCGAEISVISMGPQQADSALREAFALGADGAYLASDRLFAGADSWATALVLALTIIKTGPYDVIFAGEKATDGETGQVGPEVAAMLGMPCATYVSALDISDTFVTVKRTVEDGTETQRLSLPAFITVLSDINDPDMPTLNGKKLARRSNVRVISASDIDLAREEVGLSGSPTRVVKIEHPKISRRTEFYRGKDIEKGVKHVVEILKELAVI